MTEEKMEMDDEVRAHVEELYTASQQDVDALGALLATLLQGCGVDDINDPRIDEAQSTMERALDATGHWHYAVGVLMTMGVDQEDLDAIKQKAATAGRPDFNILDRVNRN